MDAVLQLFSPTADQKGLRICAHISPEIPVWLMGDTERLQQVLSNLIGNAIKFTHKGTVRVDAHLLPFKAPRECRVLLSVTDTGIGIREDKLDELFNPFSQLSRGYTRDYQGAGLGLSICKRLARLMSGHIAVESVPGDGTTVYFCVPFTRAEPDRNDSPQAQDLETRPKALSILFAEDERVNRLTTKLLLERLGHMVTTAKNGREVLEVLKEGEFDFVLMDIQMPVMDGLEATRRIRAGEAGQGKADIPIIALTAYAMVDDKERFQEEGVDGHLSKPVELASFQEALDKVLGQSSQCQKV